MLRTDFSWQRMGQRPWLTLYNRFLRKDNEEQPTLQVRRCKEKGPELQKAVAQLCSSQCGQTARRN